MEMRGWPRPHEAALSAANCRPRMARAPSMCKGDGPRDEVAIDHFFAQPSHKAQGQQRTQGKAEGPPFFVPPTQCGRQGCEQQGGQSGKCAEQPVDELDPGMEGVEVGVIVPFVVGPQACGTVRFEGGSGAVVGRGHPQGVGRQNHAAGVIGGIRLPPHLGFVGRGNGQPKALGPIGTSHARTGHPHNAAGEDHQKSRDEGGAGCAPNPSGQAVFRGHGYRRDSGA